MLVTVLKSVFGIAALYCKEAPLSSGKGLIFFYRILAFCGKMGA